MKKIMFNDMFHLTDLVLDGTKTHTRRIEDEPRYEVGDVVAVAQAYMDIFNSSNTDALRLNILMNSAGWRNKMFVRADEMPHKIRITKRWREMLQDISEEDAMKEGILYVGRPKSRSCFCFYKNIRAHYAGTAKDAFSVLIDSVSGKGTWKSNPEVTVYEFELAI